MNNQITGHTVLTGLLGSPVAHSISPLMHNEAFTKLGLDYVYLCFDLPLQRGAIVPLQKGFALLGCGFGGAGEDGFILLQRK